MGKRRTRCGSLRVGIPASDSQEAFSMENSQSVCSVWRMFLSGFLIHIKRLAHHYEHLLNVELVSMLIRTSFIDQLMLEIELKLQLRAHSKCLQFINRAGGRASRPESRSDALDYPHRVGISMMHIVTSCSLQRSMISTRVSFFSACPLHYIMHSRL